MLNFIDGKKTYLVALGFAVFAVLGFALHQFDVTQMINYLLEAGALVGIRSALNK